VKSSLTVIGYLKLSRANASDALTLYIQTRRSARNRRPPRPDTRLARPGAGPNQDRHAGHQADTVLIRPDQRPPGLQRTSSVDWLGACTLSAGCSTATPACRRISSPTRDDAVRAAGL